jgi:hypothetical protein
MTQLLSSLLTAAITAPLAAWLTAHFALRRFYSEKVWERKAAAYSLIFQALHDMRRWFDEHRAYEPQREMPDDAQKKLSEDYREADATLARQLDRETWLLPSKCSERLAQMWRDLAKADDTVEHDWYAHLDIGRGAINSALEDIRTLARGDLKIDRAKYMKLRRGFFRLWIVAAGLWIAAWAWHYTAVCRDFDFDGEVFISGFRCGPPPRYTIGPPIEDKPGVFTRCQ